MRSPGPTSRSPKNRNKLVFGLLGAALVFTIVAFTWNQGLKAYDRSHLISVTCVVTSAKAGTGGSTSTRGVGTRFDQVVIDSPDCGPLTMRRGVTRENKQQLAQRLARQEQWSFRVGAGSYELRSVLHLLGERVLVQGCAGVR